ncbi:hypothetical protein BGZ91_002603 [Linnemannia elongata]|nr:hypothetical protein BGZ91_002603 [Linnemannia elongata]
MSSNGSGSSKSRPSMSSLCQTSDFRGDSALDSGQTQEQVYRQGQGYGGSFGEGYHLPPFQHHQRQHPQNSSASFTKDANNKNGAADEQAIQQQHLSNLLQDEAKKNPHRTASPLASPAVSSSATPSSMISLPHLISRIQCTPIYPFHRTYASQPRNPAYGFSKQTTLLQWRYALHPNSTLGFLQERTYYGGCWRSAIRTKEPQEQSSLALALKSTFVFCLIVAASTSPLGSGVLDAFQDRTAMTLMQQYLTSPDDPESEADIQMQIMISQAAVDSKGFEVLIPQSVESIKRHHATLSSRIAALTARLSLESKIREAAQSLLKLHADNKKLARQASDHLEAANRKVDQVATELWKLTQLAADLQRTLLQHTSGVLALGVVRLEDQGRRERDMHALQLQEARVGKDVEEQLTIMSLESDTLEAQSLLEDKDRTIERLMKQLDHQRDLYVRLDEQQQKVMALSRSQQKDLDLLDKTRNDAKTVAELEVFLSKVAGRLQGILQTQQQQQQQYRHQKQVSTTSATGRTSKLDVIGNNSEDQHREDDERDRSAQTWPSDSTLLSKRTSRTTTAQESSVKDGPGREDSMSSSTRDGNSNLGTTVVSERTANSSQESTLANDKTEDTESAPQHVSQERIFSTLDALDHFMTESQQKSQILEGELSLLRRQTVVMSESRNNSIKIKNFSSVRGQAAEETIRSALEKSLKDALLEKEIARQELENERQRWQDDQNHRISALEESLVAVEDSEKSSATGRTSSDGANADGASAAAQEEIIRTLRQQLHEAIDEIDTLSQQQQSSLKSMRQLFDLIPDSRRKSHLQLFSAHQQQQRNSSGSTGGYGSGRASPAGSISSVSSGNAAIGFSMETLIVRVKELVARSQQLEQDSFESKHPRSNQSTTRSRQSSHQGSALLPPKQADAVDNQEQQQQQQEDSTWVSNSELERLQANAGMIQLLEKEIELLKQHTDMLLDENARLAEMAAASATAVSHPPSRSSADLRAMIRPPSKEDALDELHEIIRVKDTLLRERDQLVEQQEKALLKVRSELAQATYQSRAETPHTHATFGGNPGSPPPPLSSFDVVALEEFRLQCDKLEEQNGEMRMIIAALEAAYGGPGSGAQLLKALQSTNTPTSPNSTTSWLSSRLGAAGSLSFGSLSQKVSPEPSASSSAINTPIPSSVDAFSNNNNNNNNQPSQHQQQQNGAGTLSGGSNAAITSATAALRKEFRRVMTALREEKEKAVRKEVEERRRLERTVRQLRRELQAIQNSEISAA